MAETTFSVTYDDHEPPVVYSPTGAWSRTGGKHVTSSPGASFSFDFYGSEVELLGTVEAGASYTASLDGGKPVAQYSGTGGVLSTWRDLASGKHTIEIEVESGQLAFDEARFIVRTGLTGANVQTQEIGYVDTARWTYDTGAWKQGVTTGQTSNTLRTVNVDSPATVFIEGDAVWLMGSVFPDHGQFVVHVDDKQFGPFDASSDTFIPGSTLFYTPLERGKNHTFWMVNRTLNKFVDLESVRVLTITGGTPVEQGDNTPTNPTDSETANSASGGSGSTGTGSQNQDAQSQAGNGTTPTAPPSKPNSTSKSAPIGVISGAVVAVVLVLVLAFLGVLLWRRRRKQQATRHTDLKAYGTDSPIVMVGAAAPGLAPTPWIHPRSASPALSNRKRELVPPSNSYISVPTRSPPPDQQHQPVVVAQVDMDQILQYVASRMDSSQASSSGRGSVAHDRDDAAPPRYASA